MTEATERKHRLALPSLHGMRFVAATSVVFVHGSLELPYTNQLVGGFLLFGLLPIAAAAVSYFFLLSGFVNTWTWQASDTARTFYWRRFSRFLPSYYVVFIIAVILMLTVGPRVGILPTLAQGLLVQSWVPSQGYVDVLNSLSWSLSVEFFCYLLLPFIVRWVRSIRPERLWSWVIGLIAVIIALPFISNAFMPTQPPHPLGGQSLLSFLGGYFSASHQIHNWDSASFPQVWLVYHFPLARIPDFLLGVFMARIIQTGRWIGISRRTCLFILVPALIGAMFVPFLYELNSITIVPMVLLLGAIAFADDNRMSSLLAKKPMVFMGNLTYSIYLVHGLILTYGHMLFGTTPTPFGPQEKSWGVVGGTAFLIGVYLISLGVAWVLWRCVEVPATVHLSHRRRRPTEVISQDLESLAAEPASRDPVPADMSADGPARPRPGGRRSVTGTSAALCDTALPALPLVMTAEEDLLRKSVATLSARFGPDYQQRLERAGEPATEFWRELGRNGFLGVHLPEDYGGGGGGLYELAAVIEETAAAGVPALVAVFSSGVNGTILAQHGTPRQKDRWLRSLATGESISSFAITEPDSGLNSHAISTTARRDEGGWVISGQKCFISGIDEADWAIVVARTGNDEQTGRGRLTLFLVDTDAPGLSLQPLPTALQIPEKQFTVYFDNVRVGPDRLIGEEHRGLRMSFAGINAERLLVSAIATGVGRYALDKAVRYARERTVWRTPIGAHQAISHPLAEAKVELELARLMTQKALMLYDLGKDDGQYSNMAKLTGADAGLACLDAAIQTHGGSGVAQDSQLSNYWFLLRTLRIGPVSKEMILNFIAEHTLGLPRSY